MNTMCFLLTIGLCILLTFSVSAQTPPHWGLTAFYTYEALNQQRPAWYAGSLSLQRQFARQTLIAELAVHQRFNRRDVALAFDSWSVLWPGAYGNLHLQHTPNAHFLPTVEAYLEVYQNLGAWELALSSRPRFFPEETVPTFGWALARYEGNWYLRGRTLLTVLAGHLNWTHTFMARRYWHLPLAFIDLQAGYGHGVEVVDIGPKLQAVRTYFVTARVQRFVARTLGVSIGLSYSNDDLFTRRGFSIGLLRRW